MNNTSGGDKIVDIFKITREGEKNRFKDLGNIQLLWHGSRVSNFGGKITYFH